MALEVVLLNFDGAPPADIDHIICPLLTQTQIVSGWHKIVCTVEAYETHWAERDERVLVPFVGPDI